ncbi:hypothetical protein Hdeb2414_s0052g00752351 [Helianthus debilis subsp. tardiflorus]
MVNGILQWIQRVFRLKLLSRSDWVLFWRIIRLKSLCVRYWACILIVKPSAIVLLPKRLCDPDFILFVFFDSTDCNCRFIFFSLLASVRLSRLW